MAPEEVLPYFDVLSIKSKLCFQVCGLG